MFYTHRKHKVEGRMKLYNIYKDRCHKLYTHTLFDQIDNKSSKVNQSSTFNFYSLQLKFKSVIEKVIKVQSEANDSRPLASKLTLSKIVRQNKMNVNDVVDMDLRYPFSLNANQVLKY